VITVACVWVHANVPYATEYVIYLRRMVKRNLARPHRFVCLTDKPRGLPRHIEAIEVPRPRARTYGWWSKLELFNRAHALGDRVLYLDLDSLVVAPLDPIVDFPAPFALIPDERSLFVPRNGLQAVHRFNSSVMVWSAGANERLYDDWTHAVTHRLFGDQDWIGEQMPEAATLPLAWTPRISELNGGTPGPEAIVVLAKKPKNQVCAARWPWFNAVWRAA
jgi:hypothetical protein